MIDFLWGAESAHEDSIGLVVFVSTDPPALLTSGADRCVKAWRLDGGPQGLLLQGLAPHAPNPRWSFRCAYLSVPTTAILPVSDRVEYVFSRRLLPNTNRISTPPLQNTLFSPTTRFERRVSVCFASARLSCPSFNVEALAQAENAEAKTVLSAMRRRRAETRLAAQEAANAATSPDPTSQRHHHHHHHHHHHRRKRSSAGGVSLPPAQPSPLKQAQLLRQRKESTAAMARASLEKESTTSGDGRVMPDADGSSGEGRFSGSHEAARHLALQATSEGIGSYSKSDSFSDWTRYEIGLALRVSFLRRRWHNT